MILDSMYFLLQHYGRDEESALKVLFGVCLGVPISSLEFPCV